MNWPFLLGQATDILWDYRQDWIIFFSFVVNDSIQEIGELKQIDIDDYEI